jgi:curved DNA-binding protein CbpA
MIVNSYKILNIENFSELDVIKKAYKQLSIKFHPDKTGSSDFTKFNEINNAYDKISTSEKKTIYDQELKESLKISATSYSFEEVEKNKTYIVKLNFEDLIRKRNIKFDNNILTLPGYYSPIMFFDMSNKTELELIIKLKNTEIEINNYKFKFAIVHDIACTILTNDEAYYLAIDKKLLITPKGIEGLNKKKTTIKTDLIISKNKGFPVMNAFGEIVNSILIIKKENND